MEKCNSISFDLLFFVYYHFRERKKISLIKTIVINAVLLCLSRISTKIHIQNLLNILNKTIVVCNLLNMGAIFTIKMFEQYFRYPMAARFVLVFLFCYFSMYTSATEFTNSIEKENALIRLKIQFLLK